MVRWIWFGFIFVFTWDFLPAQSNSLPPAPPAVINPVTIGYRVKPPNRWFGITRSQLYPTSITGPDSNGQGLVIDLQDTTLFGTIYSGVFYFEKHNSDFLYPRYREKSRLRKGKGIIRLHDFFTPWSKTNVNGWTNQGVAAYRLELWRLKHGRVESFGFHDASVHFRRENGTFRKSLSLTEGPIVNLITSDHPDWLVISFETDLPSQAWVQVPQAGRFSDGRKTIRHEIRIRRLRPNSDYTYRIIATHQTDSLVSPYFPFQTAPPAGAVPVTFAYTGDGRAGMGGGEREYLGVNQYTLRQIAAAVYRKGASFLLFGGDMVSGYTNYRQDFILQFKAFKQSLFGYLVQKPLFTALGNHEALLHDFESDDDALLRMDRWPYQTESAEAVFGGEFVHPENGPQPYPDMPPYRENVYSFSYGHVKIIVFNNNYWWTSHDRLRQVGGCPEGYILPNQMEWIRQEINAADENPDIRFIILMAQEPVFPNGGHLGDAMWQRGDNRLRAWMTTDGTKVKPFGKGLIEVRNTFWEIISSSPKTVAVLGSDEHAYHRTLITSRTPVGVFPQDDLDANGQLDDGQYSPDPEFIYPVWSIVSGGAGAPYYVREDAPWKDWLKIYSSHYNYVIFQADSEKIGLKAYNLTGQLLDEIDNLKAAKND